MCIRCITSHGFSDLIAHPGLRKGNGFYNKVAILQLQEDIARRNVRSLDELLYACGSRFADNAETLDDEKPSHVLSNILYA